jgi:hypothetical protein
VTIAVERVREGNAGRRQLRVQADYSLDAPARSRHSKHMLLDLDLNEKTKTLEGKAGEEP